MSRNVGLSVVVCLFLILNSSAQTISLDDSDINSPDPDSKEYTLNPYCSSWPTVNDTGDMIGNYPPEQAHFAFDLSSIPSDATIISATFSAYFKNDSSVPSTREIWYNSDDNWINLVYAHDPGNSVVADEIIGSFLHDDSIYDGYVWKTVTITYDGWANDIADGFISLMITGGQSGAIGLYPGETGYTWGVLKEPELTLTVLAEPNDPKVYKNIFDLGPEEIIKADGSDINMGQYSVPSTADWNNDGLMDLIVGSKLGKVRIYLNIGTKSEPKFSELNNKAFYAKSYGSDIYCTPSGCMGCFPRVVDWDSDGMKDLIIGQSDGSIKFFRNINTDNDPSFDNGTLLKHLYSGYEVYIDVGSRATPDIVDWNNDGLKDIVSGALDGKIHIFLNEGTNTEPVLGEETVAIQNESTLLVPSSRSCPVIRDLDFDGKKDLLTGNTDGQLLLYKNIGTDESPIFSDYKLIDSNGIAIHLPDLPRSRQFVCYWDEDGYPDVLIGSLDGKIRLYRCKTLQADFDKDGDIDFIDWAIFANYSRKPLYADKAEADLNNDGKVDIEDASWIAANWLLDIK